MALLEVEDLRKNFNKTEVLRGISFTLEEGQILSVIGPSGNGKTTLLRCLNSLEKIDEGTVKLNGEVVLGKKDKKKEKRAINGFGLVFQSFNLFPQYTAYDNIRLPLTLAEKARKKRGEESLLGDKTVDERVRELLVSVGLGDKADNYPCELSGGQQQRVAIARALTLKPEVLCFDEPTSALDPELTGEVLKVICSLKDEGRTMIIVTHEMQFAKNVSDKIIFLYDGKIEEEGAPEDIFGNPKSEKLKSFLNKINIQEI